MARKWNREEKIIYKRQLSDFYTQKNRTLKEIANILKIGESTVYDRLRRLNIPVQRNKKPRYNNIRTDLSISRKYSGDLAEFVGILLGDGHLTSTQVTVTLGNKENDYVRYVAGLMEKLYGISPKIITSKKGYKVVYLGSTVLVRYFKKMGLAHNKVKAQVNIPKWIFQKKDFMKQVVKGLFDTDGSVYKLKYGIQLSFTNRSMPLLTSYKKILRKLGFSPSQISDYRVYITKQEDIKKFTDEIGFSNFKHKERLNNFLNGCVV